MRSMLVIAMLTLLSIHSFAADQQQNRSNEKPRDNMGRELIRGPVGSGYYNNVHIISDSVGIQGYSVTATNSVIEALSLKPIDHMTRQQSVTVTNSVIEAPVCIRTGGQGATISNNILICDLCIEFTDKVLINNTLTNNQCAGRGTNRPDVFGW
jgi:hypothetical protein